MLNDLARPTVNSPASGVRRQLLEREAAERGHATSIVEYKLLASFNTHEHPLGEEIFQRKRVH